MSTNYLKVGDLTRKDFNRSGRTLVPARVVDVILDESHPEFESLGRWDSIGVIKYKILGKSKKEEDTTAFPYAYPLRSHLKYIPLKNEIVLLTAGPSQKLDTSVKSATTYYIDIVSIWNHPHYNAFPEDTTSDPDAGQEFISKSDVNPMLPFAGDFIMEGRQGQSIRLSSTIQGKTPWTGGNGGDPIIVISNGQIKTTNGYEFIKEDINADSASIYLTSTQNLPIKASRQFSTISPTASTQGQVTITADGLHFNTRTGDAVITASNNAGIIGESTSIEGVRNVTVQAPLIKLGNTAIQPVLLADSTLEFLNPLLDDLILLCNALALTPVPQVQLTAANLSLKIATFKTSEGFMKSTKVKAQ